MRSSIRVLVAGIVAPALLIVGAPLAAAAPPEPSRASEKRPSTPQLIERARERGVLNRYQADLYLAYALADPQRLPEAFLSDAPWRGTLPLLHLRERIAAMPSGRQRTTLRETLAAGGGPPTKCGNNGGATTTLSTHFRVDHPATVAGGLTVAGYITSLETSWTTEIDSFGWAAPPLHPSAGGKYHVVIDDLGSGLYGFVTTSGTYAGSIGNNPNTTWPEDDAIATCMVLNDDYTPFPGSAQQALDATTAHEFNHSIQFGYGALIGTNTPDDSFVEGGATWMEDEVFDASNDNHNYLWPVFSDDMGEYTADPYPYWLTFRGLTERFGTGSSGGGEQVMQDFWEDVSKGTTLGLNALNHGLQNKGSSLANAYHDYAIAARFSKACAGSYVLPYCFEEGAAYVASAGVPPLTGNGGTIASAGGTFNGSVADNYALNWVTLPASSSAYRVALNNTAAGGRLRGTIACDTGSALLLTPMPAVVGSGASTSVPSFNSGACSSAVLVITNQAQTGADPTTSTARTYSVSVTDTPDDASPPTAPVMAALGSFRTALPIPLKWTPSIDPQSGISSYTLQRRSAAPNRALGAWTSIDTLTGTRTTFTGVPGSTYCFRVTATNGAGLQSTSAQQCTSLPVDDRGLTRVGKWARRTGTGHYLNTYTRGSARGVALKRSVKAKRLALVVTKCPSCGTVKVFFRTQLLKKLSLRSATTKKKVVLALASFAARRSGTLKIKIVSSGKSVRIDGLGASSL